MIQSRKAGINMQEAFKFRAGVSMELRVSSSNSITGLAHLRTGHKKTATILETVNGSDLIIPTVCAAIRKPVQMLSSMASMSQYSSCCLLLRRRAYVTVTNIREATS